MIIILHIILEGYTNSRMLIRVWTLSSGTYFYIYDKSHIRYKVYYKVSACVGSKHIIYYESVQHL